MMTRRDRPRHGTRNRALYDLLVRHHGKTVDVAPLVKQADAHNVKTQLEAYGMDIQVHSACGRGKRGVLWRLVGITASAVFAVIALI